YSNTDGRVFENMAVWPRIFATDARTERLDNGRLTLGDYHETTNSITFIARVRGSTPMLAHTSVVSDGGWRARMQSRAVLPVGKVDGLFLSITIPAGIHRITLDYRPPGLALGVAISTAVALTLVVATYRYRRKLLRNPANAVADAGLGTCTVERRAATDSSPGS